jgi:uncharacterized protein
MSYTLFNYRDQTVPYPIGHLQPNQINKERHINSMTLQGKGELTVKPDQAKLMVGVVTENKNAQLAQQENAQITNAVIQAIKQLGINENDIKTSQYSIQPQYDYIDGKAHLRGYRVEHQLEVTVKDISKVGIVYDVAVRNGANQGGNIQFLVSNPDVYYRVALKRAIIDAKEKAEAISESIGAVLNKLPIKITEEVVRQDHIYPVFSYKLATASIQEAPPIQKGEFTIVAHVKVVYEYRAGY